MKHDLPAAIAAGDVARGPLYVDLDGTLLATDTLHESLLQLLRVAPKQALQLPGWLGGGKAAFKRRIADHVQLDVTILPYREEVLAMVRQAREAGRRVVLATAADRSIADAVAAHLGLFDAVLASDGQTNLSGQDKLRAIEADAAGQPFTYAGDGAVDLDVWARAGGAVVVSNASSLRRQAATRCAAMQPVDVKAARLKDVLYQLRLHQWLKNLLVFVPLLPVLNTATPAMLLHAALMFLAFGFVASANYVFNDLLDLASDRQHHRKRTRPIAAGVLSIRDAGLLAGAMLLVGVAIAAALPPLAMLVLAGYFVLTNLYSLWLKRRMLIDVFALASLYTVRIFAGAAATGVPPSFWLMAFSIFIFLSLALAKRYVEVRELVAAGKKQISGRAYLATDDVFVLAAGLAAGHASILTLSLYLHEPTTREFYSRPQVLWLMGPLMLYWLIRLWLKAHRGEMHDDPVVFAAMDGMSRVIILVCIGLIIFAL